MILVWVLWLTWLLHVTLDSVPLLRRFTEIPVWMYSFGYISQKNFSYFWFYISVFSALSHSKSHFSNPENGLTSKDKWYQNQILGYLPNLSWKMLKVVTISIRIHHTSFILQTNFCVTMASWINIDQIFKFVKSQEGSHIMCSMLSLIYKNVHFRGNWQLYVPEGFASEAYMLHCLL